MADRAMDVPEHPDNVAYDVLVDCIGQACPLPVLKARKALKMADTGAIVRVDSSDPMAILDVPHMAQEDGHELVNRWQSDDRTIFWIKRGSA